MGRDCIGRALSNRENIVLTHDLALHCNPHPEGIRFDDNLRTAIDNGWSADKETFIIRGTKVYEQCFKDPYLYNNMQTIYRTIVIGQELEAYQHDCKFPFEPDGHEDWEMTQETHNFEDCVIFQTFTRINREQQFYECVNLLS